MGKEYRIRTGGRIPKEKAQVYGETIDNIIEDSGELVSPELIVTHAKRRRNPLHGYFTWDDTEAAKKYRIEEAKYLLRHITVVVKYEGSGEEQDVRAFANIRVVEEGEQKQGYTSIEVVKENKEYMDFLIEDAHGELVGWRERYKQYRDLQDFENKFVDVFEAVEAMG